MYLVRMSSDILIGDIETDSLTPTVIHMVGVLDYNSNQFTSYVGEDVAEGLVRLAEADLCIGHNFIGYDAKHIERLTEGLVLFERPKIVDTLDLSKRLMPTLPNHKLATWGDFFGYPKLPAPIFDRFTPAMIPYCERDCRLNKRVFDYLMTLLA